jgi:hypothetical protein
MGAHPVMAIPATLDAEQINDPAFTDYFTVHEYACVKCIQTIEANEDEGKDLEEVAKEVLEETGIFTLWGWIRHQKLLYVDRVRLEA